MTSVNMRPLSEHVGIEASGVDLNRLDDDTFGALRDAVANHGILFVRDQSLTPEQHIAFARRWGEIDSIAVVDSRGTAAVLDLSDSATAEVAPWVKMIWLGLGALSHWAIFSRLPSNAWVAMAPGRCCARCTLAAPWL